MTTDPANDAPALNARPARPGVSVRTRIVAAVTALVLLALACAGVLIYTLESARVESIVLAQADQEIAEFRSLQSQGIDPRTDKPFSSAEDLLYVFLQRNVPADDEVFVAWVDDRARYQSTGGHSGLAQDAVFADTVRELLDAGGSRKITTTHGEVALTVQPVHEPNGLKSALVVATSMDDARSELRTMIGSYAVVSLLSLMTIMAVAAWQAGRLLAPIRHLNETARQISETDLSARLPVSGNDDLSALTRTINDMLARLEEGFTNQRHFLDDAGHELKTPLTVLRGHLEVLDADNPEDVAETRDLLLDEVDRMTRLVGDLILLAKSRNPDFLALSQVELAPLTDTVLAKVRALGERDWRLDESGDATVTMDAQRITQAMLQLADNAVKHTGPGDVIALGSLVDDDTVRLWVRDTGAGVAPEQRARIFERFGRDVVPDEDEGLGLGLSIVRAIVTAHDGTIHVQDGSPTGACFEITLPRKGPTWPTS